MYESRRKALIAALAGTVALMCPWTSRSADSGEWPARSITMIVPFPPGGPTDMGARMVARKISGPLGQAVVVQNLPGANGIIGMRHVAGAKPDGYTILYNTSSLVLSPHLYIDPGFDPIKDFDAVSSTTAIPLVVLAHPGVPVADFQSFVSYANERGGNLSYATAGNGNVTHVTAALLMQAAGMRAIHVAYRGSAQALAAVISGQVQFMVNPVSDALAHIQAGRLRALAVTSTERIAALPHVPTVAEAGIPGFQSQAWYGVMVPKGTPAPVVQHLNAAVRQALATDDMQTELAQRGARALGSTSADYARYIQEEDARWGAVIRAANIRPD
jgi:tripartite-type tricarboxylate transporter receptor subunit TctC